MNKIILLTDYRGHFYSSTTTNYASLNFNKVAKIFESSGFVVEIKSFSDIDFRNQNYSKIFVLYQSSEDPDLRYKSFIDDIIYGLHLQGAILIPGYEFFKAHHNKVFMEILRDLSANYEIKNIKTKYYGTLEDFINRKSDLKYPLVLKSSEGAGSRGVVKVNNFKQAFKKVKFLSKSISLKYSFKDFLKQYYFKNYVSYSNFRRKLIAQNFISNLNNDYKILVYPYQIFILKRENRKNDFRASGSGLFEFTDQLPEGILEYSYQIFKSFNVPYISLDVAFNGNAFYLIEFQFVSFGTLTLEKSPFHYEYQNEKWMKIDGKKNLEDVFAHSIIYYLKSNFK
ncbi:MAG: hypothetical protein HXX18_03490 [Bacteroidetes bacterium]|nr:hypothetical protein [Bacteroidota bacterium]